MKTQATLKMMVAGLMLLALLIAGCATKKKVDWESRLGTYTYDQAVTEYGPPDKQTKLSDGQTVADWITHKSGGGSMSFGFGVGSHGSHTSTGVGVSKTVGSAPDVTVVQLTFGPDGKLVHYSKK